MSRRIAWFTPFHKASAIGHVGNLICTKLATESDITIFSPQSQNLIDTEVKLTTFDPESFKLQELEKYDDVIYNMGNYAGNHMKIWDIMQNFPGVCILHDQTMLNFFAQISLSSEFATDPTKGEEQFSALLHTYYGDTGELLSQRKLPTYYSDQLVRIWDTALITQFSVIEPILEKSIAVFTHAGFFANKVRTLFTGSVDFSYLPVDNNLGQRNEPAIVMDRNDDKTLVVISGMVHPIKRIHKVTEMLLNNADIREAVNLVVIGSYGGEYGENLVNLSKSALAGSLTMLGYQEDAVLHGYLQAADFCVNIRYPNSEVCSLSLLEQMAMGKATIVLDSGFFGEVPDNCVIKYNLENEDRELANAFRHLINDKKMRDQVGENARRFALDHCNVDTYTDKLTTFLDDRPAYVQADRLLQDTITDNRDLINTSPDTGSIVDLVDTITNQITKLFSLTAGTQNQKPVLGIWLGFAQKASLKREGLTRFLAYLSKALLEIGDIEIEIWCYDVNYDEVRLSFEKLDTSISPNSTYKIITESNYINELIVDGFGVISDPEVSTQTDDLNLIARYYSKASVFLTGIVYLDSVLGTGRPVVVPIYDLGIHSNYSEFVDMDALYKARFTDIDGRKERLARNDAQIVSHSQFIMQEHVLKYTRSYKTGNIHIVYLPVNLPDDIESRILTEDVLRVKYRLPPRYLFYPTQIRPYKNLATLAKALNVVNNSGESIKLVLTGNIYDDPQLVAVVDELNLANKIISLDSVPEEDLYSLYKYASAAIVPTKLEGGFPWQASEALYMRCPVALSDIPVVRERIIFHGFSVDSSGLILFDPDDPLQCAQAINTLLSNRDVVIDQQSQFRSALLAYTWADTAAAYRKIFFNPSTAESRFG